MPVIVTKLHTLTGHRDSVYALQPGDAESIFFSAGGDGMVVKWNLNHPEEGELIAQLPHSVYSLHYHNPSDLLVAGHNYEGIHFLDWKNNKEVGSLQLTTASIFDLQSLGSRLFVATGDGSLIEVDMEKKSVKNRIRFSEKSARTIAIHEQSNELAVGYSDNFIRLFNLTNLTLKSEFVAHTNSVFTLRYSRDGDYLLSGSRDARLKRWNVKDGHSLSTEVAAHMYAINHLDFSPDNKHFVTCSLDKSIKVWETEGLQLLKVIDKARHAGHGTSVNRLLWTNFQAQLVSASDDRTISVWKIDITTGP